MALCLLELCFSLVPPLWELCYSLSPSDDEVVLGNSSEEGGVLKEELLVPLSPFFLFFLLFCSFFFRTFSFSLSISLSLLSSPFPSPFPSRSHSLFFSFPLPFSFLRFFEGTAYTVHSRNVRDGTVDCNQLYLHWNKEQLFF